MENMSGSLSEWGMGAVEVVRQLKRRKLTNEEVNDMAKTAKGLSEQVDFLYSETFVKELSDCRAHLKSLLASTKQLKKKLHGTTI